MTGLLTGHYHLKGHLFKLGLANSPECDRCKQAYETSSHILCDCEALATLKFRHLGYFMKPGDSGDISVSRILHFVQGMGLLNESAKELHKRLITVELHRSLRCLPFCILFYSILNTYDVWIIFANDKVYKYLCNLWVWEDKEMVSQE